MKKLLLVCCMLMLSPVIDAEEAFKDLSMNDLCASKDIQDSLHNLDPNNHQALAALFARNSGVGTKSQLNKDEVAALSDPHSPLYCQSVGKASKALEDALRTGQYSKSSGVVGISTTAVMKMAIATYACRSRAIYADCSKK